TPEDLSAAAASLTSCARRLEEARQSFARAAAREVPELGREALAAAGESVRRAEGAVTTIADDVEQLARALRVLAHVYAQVDRGAVHQRPSRSILRRRLPPRRRRSTSSRGCTAIPRLRARSRRRTANWRTTSRLLR